MRLTDIVINNDGEGIKHILEETPFLAKEQNKKGNNVLMMFLRYYQRYDFYEKVLILMDYCDLTQVNKKGKNVLIMILGIMLVGHSDKLFKDTLSTLLKIITLLISRHINHKEFKMLNVRDLLGDSILIKLIYLDCFDLVETLIPYIDFNHTNYLGETPLMIAAKKGNIGCVKLFLSRSDINRLNKGGLTAIFYTIIYHDKCHSKKFQNIFDILFPYCDIFYHTPLHGNMLNLCIRILYRTKQVNTNNRSQLMYDEKFKTFSHYLDSIKNQYKYHYHRLIWCLNQNQFYPDMLIKQLLWTYLMV